MKKISLILAFTFGLALPARADQAEDLAAEPMAVFDQDQTAKTMNPVQAGEVKQNLLTVPGAVSKTADVKPKADEKTGETRKKLMVGGGIAAVTGWLGAIIGLLFLSATQAVVPLILGGWAVGLAGILLVYFAERIGPGGRGLGAALGNIGGLITGVALGGLLFGGWGALIGGLLGQTVGHLGGQAIEKTIRDKKTKGVNQ